MDYLCHLEIMKNNYTNVCAGQDVTAEAAVHFMYDLI